MRNYLFNLRKQCGYSQSEVISRIQQKYSVSLRYGDVERGQLWPKFTHDRAEMLAYAFDTTPEHIIEMEEKEGGYVGEYYSGEAAHRVDVEDKTTLNPDEKAFAEEYYSWANKIVDILARFDFAYIIDQNILNKDDFYCAGMQGYLSAVQSLIELEKSITGDPEHFRKAVISRRIRSGISAAIRDARAQKRNSNLHTVPLDAQLNDSVETSWQDILPSKDIPVEKICESSWDLDHLYEHLDESQINLCRFLISGRTITEAKEAGFSDKDIHRVRFYLIQMRDYGKIRWKAESFQSVEKNVSYDFRRNMWRVLMYINKKKYFMGYYHDLVRALDCKTLADYHFNKGDFVSWYKQHTYNGSFILPEDVEAEIKLAQKQSIKSRKRHAIEYATLENPVGCRYRKSKWEVTLAGKYLGRVDTLEEAVALQNKALDCRNAETTSAPVPEYAMLSYTANTDLCYKINAHFSDGTVYPIYSSSDTYRACKIMDLANLHIETGDFDVWLADYKSKKEMLL